MRFLQFGILHWPILWTHSDTAIEPMFDFDLKFEEWTYIFSGDAFLASNNEEWTQIGILHWRPFATRDDAVIEPMIDFDFHAITNEDLKVSAPLKRISTNFDVNLYLMQPPTNHPPTISTYLIFNQLRIIHPQFRPKSRSSVLEPPQNILSSKDLSSRDFYTDANGTSMNIIFIICIEGMSPFFRTRMIGKTLTRVTAGTRVGVSGASLSPTEDSVLIFEISKYRHDRSCLEMSEADGVDGGAFRKRGLTHLQWAEKPEAPEAERHLGSRIVE
ncbi:hypothetical protein V1478_002957 [Vespula squamosa]|uniref:Uncharacterized protein n=1 Tax=Vespula squamosa TaxID=30214 RepID=A0ABD2BRC2_VESSQ